jgi:class 3 adenylate cyclase
MQSSNILSLPIYSAVIKRNNYPNDHVFFDELASITRYELDSTNDPNLLETLEHFGWVDAENCFGTIVDLDGLKIALSQAAKVASVVEDTPHISHQDVLVSFVPKILTNKLLELSHQDQALTPTSYKFDGICLLVDISGFTRLSGQYCAKGKDGIDGLQKATNGYMGQLVNIIYEHGGDIIKFAGDAIICLFTEKKRQVKRRASFVEMIVEDIEHTQSENSFQAVLCAMSLREVQTDQLTVHVAISCGEICFGILGGYENKWECLVSGECLFELSQCLDDAPSKQVAITQDCLAQLGHSQASQLITEQMPSGNHLIRGVASQGTQSRQSSPNTSFISLKKAAAPRRKKRSVLMYSDVVSQIETLIPSNVIQGLKNKDFGRLAELREVTTMFMKWESYDSGMHRDLVSLQRYYVSAQEILSKSGAFIRQFLVDDKGCVLIACWGVPTCSYFDNAHRALSSAVAIKTSFNRMDMRVSFGITTGTTLLCNYLIYAYV